MKWNSHDDSALHMLNKCFVSSGTNVISFFRIKQYPKKESNEHILSQELRLYVARLECGVRCDAMRWMKQTINIHKGSLLEY